MQLLDVGVVHIEVLAEAVRRRGGQVRQVCVLVILPALKRERRGLRDISCVTRAMNVRRPESGVDFPIPLPVSPRSLL